MELQELEKLTVTKLREMAGEYEDIKGASAMKKEDLINILCEKLGIDREVHMEAKAGVDKRTLKKRIREFKAQAVQVATSGDKANAKLLRRRAHRAKRRLRKSLVKVS